MKSSNDQDYRLWVLLNQVRDAVLRARQKELNQYNISATQAATLLVIEAIGPKATATEISRRLFRKSHSVCGASGTLSRMEKKGLVMRLKDLDRKNLVRVALTDEGRQAYYQSTKQESIRQIMSSLSEEERQQLTLSLQTLRDKALGELGVRRQLPFP